MAVPAAGGRRRSGDWQPKLNLVRGANREIGVPGEEKGGRWSAPSPIALRVAKTHCGADASRRLPPVVNKAELLELHERACAIIHGFRM